jgi:long-chain fatty acid transport protein
MEIDGLLLRGAGEESSMFRLARFRDVQCGREFRISGVCRVQAFSGGGEGGYGGFTDFSGERRGKMRRKGLLSGLFLGLFYFVSMSHGAGFALYEGSARANAMGGAMVGKADDPSAIFYNPAGITQLPGTQFMTGGTAIIPRTKVKTSNDPLSRREQTTPTEENVWLPPHVYLTHQLTDQFYLGVGLFSLFGLGTEFDPNWPGRFNSYKAVIQTLNFNPNIAFKINDQLSIAAGFNVMWFDLELRNKILLGFNQQGRTIETDQRLEGDSFGYGGNVAIHYRPCQWASLGVSYRSRMDQDVEGRAKFDGFLNDTDADGSITLPDEVYMGLAIYPMPKLSLEVGAIWTNWSTFDKLVIDYDEPLAGRTSRVEREKKWEDTWRIFFGAEYKVNDMLDLRFGYVYDQEPSPDEHVDYLVPANDRHLFSFGPGIHWRGWTLDLSYTYLMVADRTVDSNGRFFTEGVLDSEFEGGHAHLIGLSVSHKF